MPDFQQENYFRTWQLLEAPSSTQHWWLANNIEILHREIN